jgi:pyruvate,water dikinase
MLNDDRHSRRDTAVDAPLVLALGADRADERAAVGGKAATLTRLLRAGLPVPNGFCLTTAAFRRFLVNAGAAPLVAELAAVPVADTDRLTNVGDRLRSQLQAAPMPLDLEQAILCAWDEILAGAACAVRSSATAEDLPDASFAGQQDTLLNVCGSAALLAAVRQCWISVFSKRTLAYRARLGIDHARVAMAVIVQELVPATTAGVLFTTNPLSARASEVLIEASYGLGEAVVSGRVSPDRFVVDRNTLAVMQRTVATKAIAVVTDPGGGVREQALDADTATTVCLSDALVQRVAQLGLAAERVFSAPQDVEWAVLHDDVFLLQSRPISVQPAPTPSAGHQVWTNMNVGEVIPDVVSPLTWSFLDRTMIRLFRDLLTGLGFDFREASLVGFVAGRLYFNLNTLVALGRVVPAGGSVDITAMLGGFQDDLAPYGGLAAIEANLPRVTLSRTKALRQLGAFIVWWLSQTTGATARNLATLTRDLGVAQRRDLTQLSETELLAAMNAGVARFWDAMLTVGGYAIVGVSYFSSLDSLCRRWLPEEHSIASQLLTGMGGLLSAEAGLDMWRLAAAAHAEPAVAQTLLGNKDFAATRAELAASDGGASFLRRWDDFMARHGHHARGEIELSNRRWADEPDEVLSQVRSYLRNMGGKDPVALHRAQAGERVRRTAAVRHRLSLAKRLAFDFVLRRAERGVRYRENVKSEGVRLTAVIRRLALELGQRATARGALHHAEDIFFVNFDELAALDDNASATALRARIVERRAELDLHKSISPPAIVVGTFDARSAVPAAVDGDGHRLSGLGVSAGVVSGPARVILQTTTDERILPGEILVAPFTDPGWTPYFQLAAGLVTDLGGLLSHGSIVAREYGLPAVVNVGSATRIIHTGDQLQIDGTRGEVRILRAVASTDGANRQA